MALALRVGIAAALLLLWEAATGGIDPQWAPLQPAIVGRPTAIVRELGVLITTGRLFGDLWVTLSEAILGLVIGVTGGAVLGVALARSQLLGAVFLPYVSIFNSLPRLALAPFLITWFGLGLASKVIIVVLMTLFVAFFTTYQGVRAVDVELVRAVRAMGAREGQLLRYVIVPSVVGWLIAAIRASVGLALVGAIIGEYVGATAGLGYQLTAATGALNASRAMAILVVLAVVALFLDALARLAEGWLLRWRPPVGSAAG